MKKIWNSFLHSIRLPQKKSVFYLNRIGMDINVIYMFILLAIASSPALLEQITSNKQASEQLHPFFLFIYFFIFYYLIITIIVFCIIILLAYLWSYIAYLFLRIYCFNLLYKKIACIKFIHFLI